MQMSRRPVVVVLAAGVAAAMLQSAGGAQASHRAHPTTTLRDALRHPAAATQPYRPLVHHKVPHSRYAMAGGCYVVRSQKTGDYVTRAGSSFTAKAPTRRKAEPLHFQALDLGKYLLYATKKDFLAGTGDPQAGGMQAMTGSTVGAHDIGSADAPSASAEWVTRKAGHGRFAFQLAVDDGDPDNPGPRHPKIAATLRATARGTLRVVDGHRVTRAARFGLHRTHGCAHWPEIQVNITGPYPHGATGYGTVRGFEDAHLHGMAFEFLGGRAHCGRPWHPYGVTYALVDCPDHYAANGRGSLLEDVVSGHTPGQGHDPVGWPTFNYWPRHDSLTHEVTYYKWLERAWRGGLRMYTNLLVENHALCVVWPLKKNNCNEMASVRLQAKRLHEFQRYIDAQNGGPGRGWFRIVKDPFQARQVINAGKVAVVMGIEVSSPLNCGETLGVPKCTADQVVRRMARVYRMGVRQMELTNKFDNAFTGVTGDNGTTGQVVNAGNKEETGHYWQMGTCDHVTANEDKQRYDKTQLNPGDDASGGTIERDSLFAGVLEVAGQTGTTPVYPPAPHCNVVGFTDLGRQALAQMMRRGMLFDPDHMSALARQQSMQYVADHHYGGVVSSHSWADDPTYRAVLRQGGMVAPHAGSAFSFVEEWRELRQWADHDYLYGIGWGSDVNGFSAQGEPRKPPENDDVDYPFTGFGGVTVHKQVSGKRVYDINTDGVDHYGLYPDWVQDGRELGDGQGDAFYRDLTRGPEAYLEMWERAIGIQPDSCRADVADLSGQDLGRVRRGMTPAQVLAAIGQPHARHGHTFTYCAHGPATVRFGRDGTVASVAG